MLISCQNMDFLTHNQKEYIRELERRNELRRSLTLPIGLSILFGGAIYSLMAGFSWSDEPVLAVYAFVTASVPASVFWASAVLFLIKSHIGYEYAYMPTAKELEEYKEKLVDFYKEIAQEDISDQDVRDHLRKEYADNAHHNCLNNNTKAAELHKANVRFVGVLLFLGLMSLISISQPFLEVFYG